MTDGHLAAFVERHSVPAIGAAVLDLSAEPATVDARVLGVTSREDGSRVELSDAWHIGSCAKSLTAALYARLVGSGRAAWSTPVAELFPDLAQGIDAGWRTATVDDLFTCRSGLPANPTRAALRAGYLDLRPPVEQRTAAAVAALAAPPRATGRFRYSNLGYTLAGAAIDRLAGCPFEEALAGEVLDPLGVTSAGFGPPPRIWGHRPAVQVGAVCIGRGKPQSPSDLRSDNPPLITPAGRLHVAVGDWIRIQRLFLDGGGFLTASSVEHLLRLPSDGRGMAMGWAAARDLDGVGLGMQGSNTSWSAASMMSDDRRRVAVAVANDGRTRVLTAVAVLAAELVRSPA